VSYCHAATPSYTPICDSSYDNIVRYATRHNYSAYIYQKPLPNSISARDASWMKLPALLRAIDSGYEFAFWMDAHSLFFNHSISLESIAPSPSASVSISDELQGHKHLGVGLSDGHANGGHMMIRNSAQGRAFLQRTWGMHPSPRPAGWWEQAVILFLLNGEHSECAANVMDESIRNCWNTNLTHAASLGVTVLDQGKMNEQLEFLQPSSFILHFFSYQFGPNTDANMTHLGVAGRTCSTYDSPSYSGVCSAEAKSKLQLYWARHTVL